MLSPSDVCGCFHCRKTFPPDAITAWTDDDRTGIGQTALCPGCGVDSVIGSASELPMTPEFLAAMKGHQF